VEDNKMTKSNTKKKNAQAKCLDKDYDGPPRKSMQKGTTAPMDDNTSASSKPSYSTPAVGMAASKDPGQADDTATVMQCDE
jgi:hypothetical protein